jgi:hypothetical protein
MLTRAMITFILGCLLSVVGMAQATIDVVHLKDGTVVKGVIIEQVAGQYVRVQLNDGRMVVVDAGDVAEITKEQVEVSDRSRTWRSRKARTGFVNHSALGLGFGIGDQAVETEFSDGTNYSGSLANKGHYARLETVNGWWLANGLMTMGMGLGLEYFTSYTDGLKLPVYLDVRVFPLSGKVTPVVILQGGYAVGLSGPEVVGAPRNGPQAAAGLGLHWSRSARRAMCFSVIYDWHRYTREISDDYTPLTFKETISSGFLRAGFGLTF